MAKGRIDRIAQRPDPSSWDEDELLTLGEAARLLWPHGPITERTLRTAVRDGKLPISRLAGKFFVTRRGLTVLSRCEPVVPASKEAVQEAAPLFEKDLAAIGRMRGR